MSAWNRLKTFLTRPRHLGRRPRRRTGRSSRSGIALLMAISTIALLTVLVTEVVHGATVRLKLATNQRDEAQAEALAQGGVQFYRLLLIASKQLEASGAMEMIRQMLGPSMPPGLLNADALWQLVPTVNSSVMRLLLITDGDEDEAAQLKRKSERGDVDLSKMSEEAQTTLKKPFLDFEGDFTASVEDEDRRIFVGRFQAPTMADLQMDANAQLLSGLMSGREQDDYLREVGLDKWELIGNLADWTDIDNERLWLGGKEDTLYQTMDLEEPYLPKNAPFSTPEEIRLVDGWERDAVWQRYGRHLTIYGRGRVNVNSAPRRVLQALLMANIQPPPTEDSLDLIIERINEYRNTPIELGGGIFREPASFVNLIEMVAPGTLDKQSLTQAIKTKSDVFRVTSEGQVGQAKVRIECIFDFSRSPVGDVVYWRVL